MDEEIERLKKKVNLQIDALLEKNQENEELKNQVEVLQQENVKLKEERDDVLKQSCAYISFTENEPVNVELQDFFSKFCMLVRKLQENGKFIAYKNVTKYSNSYCKVERSVFEEYVKEIAGGAWQEFIQKCMDFLCIKSEAGKAVFNNDKLRIYFLNKKLVNAIISDANDVAIEQEERKVV